MLRENASFEQADEIGRALLRLTDENEMGELFKVMTVTPLDAPVPPGFE